VASILLTRHSRRHLKRAVLWAISRAYTPRVVPHKAEFASKLDFGWYNVNSDSGIRMHVGRRGMS